MRSGLARRQRSGLLSKLAGRTPRVRALAAAGTAIAVAAAIIGTLAAGHARAAGHLGAGSPVRVQPGVYGGRGTGAGPTSGLIPAQIAAAYDLGPLTRAGINGAWPDDCDRGLVRLADDRARPGALRRVLPSPRAAVLPRDPTGREGAAVPRPQQQSGRLGARRPRSTSSGRTPSHQAPASCWWRRRLRRTRGRPGSRRL